MNIIPPGLMEHPFIQIIKEIFIDQSAHHLYSIVKKFKNLQDFKKNIETPTVLLKHRRFFREKFLINALQQPNEILFVTIMSKHTVKDIESIIVEDKLNVKELKVLTLKRREKLDDKLSEALSVHLAEKPTESVAIQINSAWNEWERLRKTCPIKIKLREYDSIPTLQGFVVKDQYALVELLTYNSNPDNRAAILAKKDKNPELFKLFSSSFEALWEQSKKTTSRTKTKSNILSYGNSKTR